MSALDPQVPRNADVVQADLAAAQARVAELQAELAAAPTPAAVLATVTNYGRIGLHALSNGKIEVLTPIGSLGAYGPAAVRQALVAWFQAQGDTGGGR